MRVFQVSRYWSPLAGGDVCRVSMADSEGQEFFMTITEVEGLAYREALTRAVEAIETAIAAKLKPGEVRYA